MLNIRAYIGEIHYKDGTFSLLGPTLCDDDFHMSGSPGNQKGIDYIIIGVEINGEEKPIHAFLDYEEAKKQTELQAHLLKADGWKVSYFDAEFDETEFDEIEG